MERILTLMPNLDSVIKARCFTCNNVFEIAVNKNDYYAWKRGTLIQNAFPYLTADDRELLISHTCGKCFDAMFGPFK